MVSSRLPTLLLIALILGVVAANRQQALASTVQTDQVRAQLTQIPPADPLSPTAIKLFDAGFHRSAADATWLATIQYFGGGNPSAPYPSLYALLNSTVGLDPTFAYPYLFGGIVLPWQGEPQAAIDLLERGMQQYPNNGLYPYYAGSAAKLVLKNNALAAHYFQLAIGKQDTPPAASLLAGVALSNLNDHQFALTWWQGVVDTAANPTIKERATLWRDQLALVVRLEQLIQQEDARQPRQPIKDLPELVSRGVLPAIPPSPLGTVLTYDPATHQVTWSF